MYILSESDKKSTNVSPKRIIKTFLKKEGMNQNHILLIKRRLERIELAYKRNKKIKKE